MTIGHKATTKGSSSGSSLSQSKRIASTSGKMVDRWIKGFDARQVSFDSRHSRLLDKLGAAKELSGAKK